MFNLKNRDRLADPKGVAKLGLKPAIYEPAGSLPKPVAGFAARPPMPAIAPGREAVPAPAHVPARDIAPAPAISQRDDVPLVSAPAPETGRPVAHAAEAPGSKLFVGVNIKLKGMEVSDCDVLVIEGHVEATVHSKVMQIAKPGTLAGTALVDVAEIQGVFTGELTARTRLIVHGTGRVTGTIRYGQLIVAEGGEVSGDVKPMEESAKPATPPRPMHADARHLPPLPRGTSGA
jgi:cytoskeletal protein CcmA (bactofilin family)